MLKNIKNTDPVIYLKKKKKKIKCAGLPAGEREVERANSSGHISWAVQRAAGSWKGNKRKFQQSTQCYVSYRI